MSHNLNPLPSTLPAVRFEVAPRAINEREYNAWVLDASLLGGVALCMHHCASGGYFDQYDPRLLYTWREWENFISGVRHYRALDEVVKTVEDDRRISFGDTKEYGWMPTDQMDRLFVKGTVLRWLVREIKTGKWDNPPGGFSLPNQIRLDVPSFVHAGTALYISHNSVVSMYDRRIRHEPGLSESRYSST